MTTHRFTCGPLEAIPTKWFRLTLTKASARVEVRATDPADDFLIEVFADATYLEQGDSLIPADRRRQVEQDIAALRARTAVLSVKVSVPDANIALDGEVVGRGAVDQRVIDAGQRRLRVSKAGFTPDERVLVLAGGDTTRVDVILQRVPAVPAALPTAPTETPSRPEVWIGRGTTAALAAAAGVFGGLAMSKASALEDQNNVGSATLA